MLFVFNRIVHFRKLIFIPEPVLCSTPLPFPFISIAISVILIIISPALFWDNGLLEI